MSNNSENFDKLQKLLKLKRHEVPPPGYFNHFSTKVISRIKSEQANASFWSRDAQWLGKFLGLLETNPMAAGLFGISVCGLLISGIAYSQYQPPTNTASNATFDIADSSGTSMATASTVEATASSVNPMLSTNVPGSLFGGMGQLTATPVNFTP